jgi:O-methyltransferase
MNIQALLNTHPIISDQVALEELGVVLRELERVLQQGIPGHITEFGCYTGTTSLFLRRLLDSANASAWRELHVYDSFAGLPPKVSQDNSTAGEQFKAGELLASKKQLIANFKHAGLQLPHIHKGWFAELTATEVPSPIAFAFLDGDFYESITDSLRLVWPRLSSGGIITIDDYQREALPGVERAVRDFFGGHIEVRHQATIAIIKKA